MINAHYITSKCAILGLTKSLRVEAPDFMSVGIIIPGLVNTEIAPKSFMKLGMPADEFADRLIPQMKDGQFYLVGHSYNIVRIADEYEQVKAAFTQYAPRYEGDEKYDVNILLERLQRKNKADS